MLASKAKTARAAESQNMSQNVVFVSRNPGGTGARARPSKNVSQAARAGCPADLGTSQNVSQAFVFVSQSLACSRVLVWPLERPPRGSRVGGAGGGPGSNGSRERPWCVSGTRGAVGSQGRWMGWQPGVGGRVRAGGSGWGRGWERACLLRQNSRQPSKCFKRTNPFAKIGLLALPSRIPAPSRLCRAQRDQLTVVCSPGRALTGELTGWRSPGCARSAASRGVRPPV